MMKSNLLNSLVLAALVLPGVAMADASPVTANVSLTTNYLYRGITQTGNLAAIQGGFDYANPNGVYAGTWGSSINWLGAGNSGLELDTYAGYKGGFAGDFSYDVGFLRYNYYGPYNTVASPNTNELYGAIGWKWLTGKYSRSLSNLFGVANSGGSSYLDLSGSYTLEGPAITVGAHYGKQTVSGSANSGLTYSDYNLKASKDFSGYTLGILINKTNITGDKTRGVVSVSHSL